MNKHGYKQKCARCRQTYGQHAWKNDACPTKAQVKRWETGDFDTPVSFCWFRRFKAKKR